MADRYSTNNFNYASAMPITKQTIFTLGTVDNSSRKTINITDLKMTCATAVNIKFFVSSYASFGRTLNLNLSANSTHNFTWETPYKVSMVSTTVIPRRFVASASVTGVKYFMSGYLE